MSHRIIIATTGSQPDEWDGDPLVMAHWHEAPGQPTDDFVDGTPGDDEVEYLSRSHATLTRTFTCPRCEATCTITEDVNPDDL